MFLTAIGGPTYELLRNLVLPETPKDKSLEQLNLKNTLRLYLNPKPPIIAECFKFHKRKDTVKKERLAEYIVALKELATHCNFEKLLNKVLRDRLVCRPYKELIQKNCSRG